MKKNIAVIYGGTSSEREISIKSGRFAAEMIDREKYNVYEILFNADEWLSVVWQDDTMTVLDKVDMGTFSVGGVKLDVACIMIHGIPGENGLLQAYFEMISVPVTTCSSFVCTVAFNKYSCKRCLADTGVKMAADVLIRKGDAIDSEKIFSQISLPAFVKPSDGGSSFGVSKVKKPEQIEGAVNNAFKESDTVLIEQAIIGREVTQGVYISEGQVKVLPIIEIVTSNEYFDFEAKYLGKSQEICPACLTDEEVETIGFWSEKIYKHLGCTGLIRIDYILSEEGLYFLEINTTPGMTKASLVPQMVKAAGGNMTDFFGELIENAK